MRWISFAAVTMSKTRGARAGFPAGRAAPADWVSAPSSCSD
jgi:hypothetical protein